MFSTGVNYTVHSHPLQLQIFWVHFVCRKKRVGSNRISPCPVNQEASMLKQDAPPLNWVWYRSRCCELMSAMARSCSQDTISWQSPWPLAWKIFPPHLGKCSLRLEGGRSDLDVPFRAKHSADWMDLYQLLTCCMQGRGAASTASAFSRKTWRNPPIHCSELLTIPESLPATFTIQLDGHGYIQLFKFKLTLNKMKIHFPSCTHQVSIDQQLYIISSCHIKQNKCRVFSSPWRLLLNTANSEDQPNSLLGSVRLFSAALIPASLPHYVLL